MTQDTTRYVGCDVHQDTITVAVAQAGRERAQLVSTIRNQPEAVRKLMRQLGEPARLVVAYEAGPCGYALYRQLTKLGSRCLVIAPSLIPRRPGERIKTDRRDALGLAELLRSGHLTAVHVPSEADEALRDLVRARHTTRQDVTRLRHRLTKLVLRLDVRYPHPGQRWTQRYRRWLNTLTLPHAAQQLVLEELRVALSAAEARLSRLERAMTATAATSPAVALVQAYAALRGGDQVTAITLAAELGDLSRFDSPRQVMAYVGLVPSERSSGGSRRQGRLTRTGNARARHVLIEAAWQYRWAPKVSRTLAQRQAVTSAAVVTIANQAQHRLHARYRHLWRAGKDTPVVAAAVARELVGFVWAIAHAVATEQGRGQRAAVPPVTELDAAVWTAIEDAARVAA